MSEDWVEYLYNGEALCVSEAPGAWEVRYGGREGRHQHLDHALAIALGRTPSQALPIAARILNRPPGSEVES